MGLKVLNIFLNVGKRLGKTSIRKVEAFSQVPIRSLNHSENFCSKIPELIKPLTKRQISRMKSKDFEAILNSRTDIAESFRLPVGTSRQSLIHTPEQLSLYDAINNTLLLKNIDQVERTNFLTKIMHICPENAEYAKKILPKLIDKGYDLELLSGINITENNYKFIETVLKKKNILEKKVSAVLDVQINDAITKPNPFSCGHNKTLSNEEIQKIIDKFQSKKEAYTQKLIRNLCNEVDKKNIKYFDEWCKYTDKIPIDPAVYEIGSIKTSLLRYWNKDTLKILEEFTDVNMQGKYEILEVIKRRGHNYKSIKEIFGNTKMVEESRYILEFKNYNKFKNINLENFNTLTTKEKKEFINAFISIRTDNAEAMKYLKENLKMYENIDLSSRELTDKTYSQTLKKMIESIPEKDRKPIMEAADWGKYSRNYRKHNPIPTLVDDLEKLPVKYEVVNGKKYPVSEITNNTDLAISAHKTGGDSFLNIQALEFTDPNEILCVGTKGKANYVHYDIEGGMYSIAVKPRHGKDFWIQYYCDIDSGTSSTKNVMNVSRRYAGRNDFYAYIPELIKKELNLSQREYTRRMSKLINCTTLDEIGTVDKEMENTIRKVLKENQMYEGILRPQPMGVLIPYDMPLSSVNPNVLDYVNQRNIKFLRVKYATAEIDEARRKAAAHEFSKTFGNFTV